MQNRSVTFMRSTACFEEFILDYGVIMGTRIQHGTVRSMLILLSTNVGNANIWQFQ